MSSNDSPIALWRKSSYSNGTGACVEVGTTWRKSTHSNHSGNCVEVSTATRAILVRDTTNRSGATLTIPAPAWQALLVRVRAS
jgi:hypothetical protein